MDDVFVRPAAFYSGEVCNQMTGFRPTKRLRKPIAGRNDFREMLDQVRKDEWRMRPNSSDNPIRHAQMLSGQDFGERVSVHRLWSG